MTAAGRRFPVPGVGPVPALLLVWGMIVVLHADTFRDLWRIWTGNVVFHHGPLVALIALVLIVHRLRRAMCEGIAPSDGMAGWLPAALVSWGWFAAWLADVDVGMHLAVLLLIVLAVPALVGWRAAWRARFGLFYLLLALPAGLSLIAPLQRLTADLAVVLLDLLGIEHLRDGFVIELMTSHGLVRFSIEAACSGIRYLFASMAVGLLFAHVAAKRARRRAAIVAVFALVPIVANAMRAAGIVALASVLGIARAWAIDHRLYGGVFFLLTLALSFLLAMPWTEGTRNGSGSGMENGAKSGAKREGKATAPSVGSGGQDRPAASAMARYLAAVALGPILALVWEIVFTGA